MNQRFQELESLCWEPRKYGPPWFDNKKFARLIVEELVSKMEVDSGDFYHNQYNDYGCITVKFFVPGDAHLMAGEETKAQFGDGIRVTGRFKLNEKFVEYLMDLHFGDKE